MAAKLLDAHRPFAGTCSSRSVSGACGIERCSPRPVPFPPNLRRRFPSLVRMVHRYYGAVRLLQHVHVRRSAYGLHGPALMICQRRAGDLPVLVHVVFSACTGSKTTQDRTIHSRYSVAVVLPSSTRKGVGVLFHRLFEVQSPGPPMPSFCASNDTSRCPRKTRGQDGFATSFPVGLLHPLQHAGCSENIIRSKEHLLKVQRLPPLSQGA